MVYPFALPTTSHLSFQSFLSSPTHPSLPQCASTARHALRSALKRHKRLSPSQQSSHLTSVLTALNEYIPYLLALSRGLDPNSASRGEEDIEIHCSREIEVEWRATLTSSSSISHLRHGNIGRNTRVKGHGLEFEIAFVLSTLGYALSRLARTRYLKTLYANRTPTLEQKNAAVQAAMKLLLQASSVHSYLSSSSTLSGLSVGSLAAAISSTQLSPSSATQISETPTKASDLESSTQSALSTLALAEATLLAVVKDDAYLSACIQSRNKNDTDWMIKPPDIPKVRALLFARLCVRAAEYAEQAAASVGAVGGSFDKEGGKVDEGLVGYMRMLARVSRAKGCRFFGIDADMSGKTGEGIAWLRAGRAALGFKESLSGDEHGAPAEAGGKGRIVGGFSRLRREWSERREERKIDKEAVSSRGSEREADLDWGDDAGREEEGRVIDMLEARWVKMNDTINTQMVPSSASYLSNLPSGRDIHSAPAPYVPPSLDAEQLVRMRAPPEIVDHEDDLESSEDEPDVPTRGSYY